MSYQQSLFQKISKFWATISRKYSPKGNIPVENPKGNFQLEKYIQIDDLLHFTTQFPDLPSARGYIDSLHPQVEEGNSLRISGWLTLPDRPMDSIEVYIEGRYIATYALQLRQDVQDAFAWIPYALRSGFEFSLPLMDFDGKRITKINLICCWQGHQIARLSSLISADIDRFPTPPEDYAYRVVHTRDLHFFKVGAIKTFGEFMEAACRYTDFRSVKRILDWGCGCGRVTVHFLSIVDGPEVFGCDIDPFAVDWSNNNIQSGTFSVLTPMPPSPYPDNFFDVIFSYSVFTHLTRDVQHAWLAEMQRLLTPRGLFVATIHGEFALKFAMQSMHPSFPNDGIIDTFLDPTLDGIAPDNYYRGTFQTKEYTLREFGKYFDIVEYIERGATNFQDLLIMRKKE